MCRVCKGILLKIKWNLNCSTSGCPTSSSFAYAAFLLHCLYPFAHVGADESVCLDAVTTIFLPTFSSALRSHFYPFFFSPSAASKPGPFIRYNTMWDCQTCLPSAKSLVTISSLGHISGASANGCILVCVLIAAARIHQQGLVKVL